MGSMAAFIPAGLQVASVINQQQQQRRAAKQQAEQVALQNQILARQQQQREKQQRDLLARQLAATRARLSAGGVGLNSGSGAALLSGMARQTAEDIADGAELTGLRQNMASNSLSSASGLDRALSLYHGVSSVLDKLPQD